MKTKLILMAALAVIAAGCQSTVPATKLTIPGVATFESPKQWTATNLHITLKGGGSFKADYLQSVNSPDVLATVAAANAQMADKFLEAMKLIQAMSAKGAGIPIPQ